MKEWHIRELHEYAVNNVTNMNTRIELVNLLNAVVGLPSAPPQIEEKDLPPPAYEEAIQPHNKLMQERDKAFSQIHVLKTELEKAKALLEDKESDIKSLKINIEVAESKFESVKRKLWTAQNEVNNHRQSNAILWGKNRVKENLNTGHKLTDRIVGAPSQEWSGPGLL